MKKNFFKFLLLGAFTLTLGAGFVGCKDYDGDIDDLNKKIDKVATDLAALQTSLGGLQTTVGTVVKDVAWNGSTGILTVTKQDGSTTSLDLGASFPTYDIALDGGDLVLSQDGQEAGRVALPEAPAYMYDFAVVGGQLVVKLNGQEVQTVALPEAPAAPVYGFAVEGGKLIVSVDGEAQEPIDLGIPTIPDVPEYTFAVEEGQLIVTKGGVAQAPIDLGIPEIPAMPEVPVYDFAVEGGKLIVKVDGEVQKSIDLGIPTIPNVPVYGFAIEDGALVVTVDGEEQEPIALPAAPVYTFAFEEGALVVSVDGEEQEPIALPALPEWVYTFAFEGTDLVVSLGGEKVQTIALPELPELPGDGYLVFATDVDGKVTGVSATDGEVSIKLVTEDALAAAVADLEGKIADLEAETLEGLLFMPKAYDAGIQEMFFNRIAIGANKNLADALAKGRIFESQTTETFRLNPEDATLSNVAFDYFLNRPVKVITRATASEKKDLLRILSWKGVQGAVELLVKADFTKSQAAGQSKDFVALEGLVTGDGFDKTVTSDEVKVNLRTLYNVAALNKKAWDATPRAEMVYPNDSLKATQASPMHEVATSTGKVNGVEVGKVFNLNDFVIAASDVNEKYFDDDMEELPNTKTTINEVGYGAIAGADFESLKDLEIVGEYFEFESLGFDPTDPTDQSYFLTLDEKTGEVEIIKPTAALDREPLFKVKMYNAEGKLMAVQYIKLKMIKRPFEYEPKLTVDLGDIEYLDLYKAAPKYQSEAFLLEKGLSWKVMNDEVYERLGLSHKEFIASYDIAGITLTVDTHTTGNGTKADAGYLTKFNTNPTVGTNTVLLSIGIDPQTRFGNHTWTVVIKPTAANATLYPEVTISFKFNLVAPKNPLLTSQYQGPDATTVTKGRFISNHYVMNAVMAESFVPSLTTPPVAGSLQDFALNVVEAIDKSTLPASKEIQSHTMYFINPATRAVSLKGESKEAEVASATISAAGGGLYGYLDQVISLDTKIAESNRTYDVVFRSVYYNGGIVDTEFDFQFQNPLVVTLSDFVMPTKLVATVEPLQPHVSVTVDTDVEVIPVYVDGATQQYDGRYGKVNANTMLEVPAINVFGWDKDGIVRDEIVEEKLYIEYHYWYGTKLYDNLIWDNDGSMPVEDRDEKISVTVETPYAIKKSNEATIVLQASPVI